MTDERLLPGQSGEPHRVEDGARRMVLGAGGLELVEVTEREAARVAQESDDPAWVSDYPTEGGRVAARMLLRQIARGEYTPGFGMYQVRRVTDGLVIGNVGFHGAPHRCAVEIGFDMAESARCSGSATSAVRCLVNWALSQPTVRSVVAKTTPDNIASQRVLVKAGFDIDADASSESDGMLRFAIESPRSPHVEGRSAIS